MITAREQFVDDYTLVVDNTREAYEEVMELAHNSDRFTPLSDTLREQFEDYIAEVADREEKAGREVGALLIRQMLLNLGADVWGDIARHYLIKVEEFDNTYLNTKKEVSA